MVEDARGNLTFIEARRHVPFDIERVYYLYDIPGGSRRGGHAHRATSHCLIAIAGSFDVLLADGTAERRVTLNRAHIGLHIVPMIWRELENFSSGAVCLVLASGPYDPEEYVYDLADYRRLVAGG